MLFKAESDRATNRNYTVDSILPHAEFGPNDYREGAPPFIHLISFILSYILLKRISQIFDNHFIFADLDVEKPRGP